MIRLTKEQVLQLHRMMAARSGGSVGVREEGLLESALEVPFSGFGGVDFYPTIEEKAARLGWSLTANHPFVDGNKRIGLFVMLTFLEVNGIRLNCTNAELAALGWSMGAGKVSCDELLDWVREHRA